MFETETYGEDGGRAGLAEPARLRHRSFSAGLTAAPGIGVGFAAAAYCLLTAQDVVLKTTLAATPVGEALCLRSAVILGMCAAWGGWGPFRRAFLSRSRVLLVTRALLGVLAWGCFFEAAKTIPVAIVTTIFLCAPLLVAVMAPFILRERFTVHSAIAIVLGLAGEAASNVRLADVSSDGVLLAFVAALLWAAGLLLARRIARAEAALVQIVSINTAFVALGAMPGLGAWHAPDLWMLGALAAAGLLGGLGQLCLFTALERATASSVALLQYTSLIWVLAFSYVAFGDRPAWGQIAGALLVALSGAILILQGRSRRASRSMELARPPSRRLSPEMPAEPRLLGPGLIASVEPLQSLPTPTD